MAQSVLVRERVDLEGTSAFPGRWEDRLLVRYDATVWLLIKQENIAVFACQKNTKNTITSENLKWNKQIPTATWSLQSEDMLQSLHTLILYGDQSIDWLIDWLIDWVNVARTGFYFFQKTAVDPVFTFVSHEGWSPWP